MTAMLLDPGTWRCKIMGCLWRLDADRQDAHCRRAKCGRSAKYARSGR